MCGLVDSEIQLDLLSESNQNMTLEEVLQFVEKKEAEKRLANRSLESERVEGFISQYRKNQRLNNKEMVINKSVPCSFCGKCGHGKNSSSRIRQQHCQAYNTTAIFAANSTILNLSVNSNRRTKRYKLAKQTMRWHYLVVYVRLRHCNSIQILQAPST